MLYLFQLDFLYRKDEILHTFIQLYTFTQCRTVGICLPLYGLGVIIFLSDFLLQMTGNISYNGYNLKDIVPQKTSAYVSQNDLHIPEMTVRETLDFSACCQGTGNRAGKEAK